MNNCGHFLDIFRILGSVGEPINPEAWLWYYKRIGNSKCSIVDTFWQTETGGHVITPLPGATKMKPGSAVCIHNTTSHVYLIIFYFFFVFLRHSHSLAWNHCFWMKMEWKWLVKERVILSSHSHGQALCEQFSTITPALRKLTSPDSRDIIVLAMVCLQSNHKHRQLDTFKLKSVFYRSKSTGARRDADGYIWITGRIDDKLNVSGHLMSTAQIESVLTEHKKVSEAAVVSRPHPIKGECLYCFITPNQNEVFDKTLINELKKLVRDRIGAFAQPDVIQHAPGLPKTRSGKIMRRILRKIAMNDRNVGDTSTLADESIVEQLFANRPE